MRRAGIQTIEVMDDVAKNVKFGMNVWDVKAELVYQIIKRGGTSLSFSPGVLCVNKDSDPSRRTDPNNVLLPGSTLAFDFGVILDGYCTDFGRTLFVGEPQEEALSAYSVITNIIKEITTLLGDGKITPSEMYHLGCERARQANFYEGYGYYKWSIGHAIGLDIHEWPWLRDPHESAYHPVKRG